MRRGRFAILFSFGRGRERTGEDRGEGGQKEDRRRTEGGQREDREDRRTTQWGHRGTERRDRRPRAMGDEAGNGKGRKGQV